MDRIYILGAGGHAQEVFGIAYLSSTMVLGFVDETKDSDGTLFKHPVYCKIPEDNRATFVCGVGNPFVKKHFEEQILDKLAAPIIHTTVVAYRSCQFDKGIVIGAHCTLTIDTQIGRSTSINSNCVISHGCRVGKRCHLSGGTILSGNVTLEDDVYVGAGAKFLPKVKVGEGAVIGAGAVVTKDVDPYTIVAGCPAKILRTYEPGEKIKL